jgi:hypothetical protein
MKRFNVIYALWTPNRRLEPLAQLVAEEGELAGPNRIEGALATKNSTAKLDYTSTERLSFILVSSSVPA